MDRAFPTYRGDEPFRFVCYAHDDSAIVYPELSRLHESRLHLWYDEGISAGRNWRQEIGVSLMNAQRVLFYISRASLASAHCHREISMALDEGKDVVPVYLEKVELTPDLKIGLSQVHALWHNDGADYQARLLRALGGADDVRISRIPSVRRGWRRMPIAVG